VVCRTDGTLAPLPIRLRESGHDWGCGGLPEVRRDSTGGNSGGGRASETCFSTVGYMADELLRHRSLCRALLTPDGPVRRLSGLWGDSTRKGFARTSSMMKSGSVSTKPLLCGPADREPAVWLQKDQHRWVLGPSALKGTGEAPHGGRQLRLA